MARPRKDELDARSEIARLRLTPAEKLHLDANAAAAGLTVSEFCRRRVLGLTVVPSPARADAALISEINRIGVNVNQLAYAFNADREFRGDWEAIRDELSRVLDKVTQSYGA
jgi:Bacterial mobilisation protein (MobC)